MAMSEFEKNKRKLARDYQKILQDAEALISSLPGELDDKAKEAKEKLLDTLDQVKEQAKDNYDAVEDKVQEQVQKTDKLVRDYPYHAAGISMGVGLLFGLLLKRGR